MTAAVAWRVAPWALAVALACIVWIQHDQVVTFRLKDKDQQAIAYNLRRDIGDRDQKIVDRAGAEAEARTRADAACSADSSNSFERGVAVGRAIANAKAASGPGAGQPALTVGVRDYREARAVAAYRPGA